MATRTQKRKLSTNNIMGMIDKKPGSCPISLLLSVIAGDKLKEVVKDKDGKERIKLRPPTTNMRIKCAETVMSYIAPKLSTKSIELDVDDSDDKSMVITWAKQA